MRRGTAQGLVLGAALCWSLGGVLIKWVELHPLAIAGARSGIAALVVWAAFPRLRLTWSRFQLAGAAVYCVTVVTFVVANKLTTAANAILLQYTAPAWVALFGARFLGERARRSDWATIVLVLAGMGLFFLGRLKVDHLAGNIVAVASGFAFAWLVLLVRRQREDSPFGSIFLGNVLTALVCLPFLLQRAPDARGWAGLALLGTVQLGLAYVLFGAASRHIPALDASLLLLVEPVLNPVWTYLALGERPGPMAVAGGAIILGAVSWRAVRGSVAAEAQRP